MNVSTTEISMTILLGICPGHFYEMINNLVRIERDNTINNKKLSLTLKSDNEAIKSSNSFVADDALCSRAGADE